MHTFRQTRSYLYVTHRHNFKIQNALVSKRRTLFTWKVGNRYKWSTYLMTSRVHGDTVTLF